MNKKAVLRWPARILAIIFICFLAIFSLDVFQMEGSALEKAGGFIIHNIPVFILIILLIIAWKSEKLGGILFVLTGIIFTIFFKTYEEIGSFLLISLPPLLIGVLFLAGPKKR